MKTKKLKDGTLLNRKQYKTIKHIGSGGFGITYLAEQIGFYKNTGFGEEYELYKKPEQVVIKELFYDAYCNRDTATGLVKITSPSKNEEFQKLVKNQLDEGKTVRLLDHSNIVRTSDIFNENDTAYMVMDYVESIDLEDLIIEKKYIDKKVALEYVSQILDAVDYFHNHPTKKILHLDLKPSNILLDKEKGCPIIIDFGSALSYDPNKNEVTSRTSQLITGMTRNYSPTEQNDLSNLKKFEASFDTYAIGATLYHMLSGVIPPESGKVSSGFLKLKAPSDVNPNNYITPYLDAVVLKAISPQYPNRFHSAIEFKEALEKETLFNQKLLGAEKLIEQGNFEQAKIKLKELEQKFIKTEKVNNLLLKIKNKQKEQERLKSYNNFITKGERFYNEKEYDYAEKYFMYAQEEFPEKSEPTAWIKKCKEAIQEKAQPIAIAPIDDIEEAIEREVEEKNLAKEQPTEERQKGATQKISPDKTPSTSVQPKRKTKKITKQKKATASPMGEKTVKISPDKTPSTSVQPKEKTKKIIKQKKATASPMGEKTVKIEQKSSKKKSLSFWTKLIIIIAIGGIVGIMSFLMLISYHLNVITLGILLIGLAVIGKIIFKYSLKETIVIGGIVGIMSFLMIISYHLNVIALGILLIGLAVIGKIIFKYSLKETIVIFILSIISSIFSMMGVLFIYESVNPIAIEDSIATDSINLADENKSTQLQELEKPEQPKESEEIKEPEIPVWKINFDKTFTQIRNAESSRNYQNSINKYRELLNTLPLSASTEKNKINTRIRYLNSQIQEEEDRVAKEREREKEREKERERERERKKEREQETANLAIYNKHLEWSKNMMKTNGKDWCIGTPSCSKLVKDRLKKALKAYPNGAEARSLLNEFN